MDQCQYHKEHESRIKTLEEQIKNLFAKSDNFIVFQATAESEFKNIRESLENIKEQITALNIRLQTPSKIGQNAIQTIINGVIMIVIAYIFSRIGIK